jgi:hypothetical protein
VEGPFMAQDGNVTKTYKFKGPIGAAVANSVAEQLRDRRCNRSNTIAVIDNVLTITYPTLLAYQRDSIESVMLLKATERNCMITEVLDDH